MINEEITLLTRIVDLLEVKQSNLGSTLIGTFTGFISGYLVYVVSDKRSKKADLVFRIRERLKDFLYKLRLGYNRDDAFKECLSFYDSVLFQSRMFLPKRYYKVLNEQYRDLTKCYVEKADEEKLVIEFCNYWEKSLEDIMGKGKLKKIFSFFILKEDPYKLYRHFKKT